MFKLVDEARAWWTVTWPGVTEEGAVVENSIEMQFRLLDTDQLAAIEAEGKRVDAQVFALMDRMQAGEKLAASEMPSQIWADYLKRFTVDWRGVAAANGEALPFSTENLLRFVKVPGAFEGAVGAYLRCSRGRSEIRAGN